IQPEGPYQLVAFCGGSLIVFEMAQQLHAARQTASLVALIEPAVIAPLPPLLERNGPTIIKLMGGFIRRVGRLLRLRTVYLLDCFLGLRHVCRVFIRANYRKSPRFSQVPTMQALRNDWIGTYI